MIINSNDNDDNYDMTLIMTMIILIMMMMIISQMTDSNKQNHITNYFEEHYQAREDIGKYSQWTNKIKKTAAEEPWKNPMIPPTKKKKWAKRCRPRNKRNKRKRNKTLGPNKIANEMFIKPDKETKFFLKEILGKMGKSDEVAQSWEGKG